jgi:hypothetical protein
MGAGTPDDLTLSCVLDPTVVRIELENVVNSCRGLSVVLGVDLMKPFRTEIYE